MEQTAVYVCDCCGALSQVVDVDALTKLARALPGVAAVERGGMLCSEEILAELAERVRRAGHRRLLLAACSPRMSLKLPEARVAQLARRAGLAPAFVEVANIREQCAWLHRDDADAAARAARDALRAAWVRLEAAEAERPEVRLTRRVLIVGGGAAGLAAARSLSRAGVPSLLVERNGYLGGTLCQISFMFQSEAWPSSCESPCVGPVQASEVLFDPRVTVCLGAEIEQLVADEGDFRARIRVAPRMVDPERCVPCGLCEAACPEDCPDPFELGLARRKAIAKPFGRALPDAASVLAEACTRCGACVEVCPTGAIDLHAEGKVLEERFGAVILATGTRERQGSAPAIEGPRSADVITSLGMERLLAGQLARPSDGETPEHVVFVQCAGSRASGEKKGDGVAYCSKTCCAVTARQAKRIVQSAPETEVSVVYYRDFRTYERALEKLHQDLRAMGVEFHNGEVTAIERAEQGGLQLEVAQLGTEELEDEGATERVDCDLVVLACAQQPQLPQGVEGLRVVTDAFGFPIERQPRIFRPGESFVDRVFVAGSAAGPKGIQQAVEQGALAALRAIESLGDGSARPGTHSCTVDQTRCSRCGVCVSVCPHGAMQLTEAGARADPALCQGCGLCAASCPSYAAELHNFTARRLLAEVRASFVDAPAGEPRILALLCYWCAYGGADLAGAAGLSVPSGVRILRIRCSSSVNMGLVVEMFRAGVDGVLIAGCPPNSCHHMWGNWLAEKRTAMMKSLLKQQGIHERRLVYETIGIPHGARFAERMGAMRSALLELGPHPWAASAEPRATDEQSDGGAEPWANG